MVILRRSFALGITSRIQKLDAQAQKNARNCETAKRVPGAMDKFGALTSRGGASRVLGSFHLSGSLVNQDLRVAVEGCGVSCRHGLSDRMHPSDRITNGRGVQPQP